MDKQILAVDDSSTMLQLLEATLGSAGYNVVSLTTGEAAEKAAEQTPFDLVIADYNMPGITGIGLIARLRALPAYSTVPMLIVSGENSASLKSDAKAAGATGWVVKPFDRTRLLQLVDNLLQLSAPAGVVSRAHV